MKAYSISASKLLLSANDGSGALSGVEGSVAFDYSLAVDCSAATAGFAADASDVIPVLVGHGFVLCCALAEVVEGHERWRSAWSVTAGRVLG